MGVLELIRQRQAEASTPENRRDRAKLGLAIEGGGMRGVVSAGMVAGLESLGLLNCFDAVYGSSAGAISGAYFVAGQARYGTTIFYQDINNRDFIDMTRLLGSAPALSLEFLLDHVSENVKPLQWEAVLQSEVPLVIVASSLTDGRAVHLRDFSGKHDLRECLRASARIPVVAGAPVTHRGMRLWDALVFEAIPVHAAAQDACTHLVALLTRPISNARRDLSLFDEIVIGHLIGRECKAAQSAYLRRVAEYNDTVRALASGSIAVDGNSLKTLVSRIPSTYKPIKGTETNHKTLLEGARAGFASVFESLKLDKPQVVEVLNAF